MAIEKLILAQIHKERSEKGEGLELALSFFRDYQRARMAGLPDISVEEAVRVLVTGQELHISRPITEITGITIIGKGMVHIPRTEERILLCLKLHEPKIVKTSEIMRYTWGKEIHLDNLRQRILTLKKLINIPHQDSFIVSKYGKGYFLNDPQGLIVLPPELIGQET